MTRHQLPADPQLAEKEWIAFPGGELEAPRPKVYCAECRANRRHAASLAKRTLCFKCYRLGLDRERGIKAAAELNTASEIRFQTTLPFEPVDRVRLAMLRVSHAAAKAESVKGAGAYVDRRRRAQITARHALERISQGLRSRHVNVLANGASDNLKREMKLDVPPAWLPFVGAR
jgi:hypothetical protein